MENSRSYKILLSDSKNLFNNDLKFAEYFFVKIEILIADSLLEVVSVTEDPILAAEQRYKRHPIIIHKSKGSLRENDLFLFLSQKLW